jgi:5-methylcytosine-specific restriction endonuclease McrA
VDHFKPRSKGGTEESENLVTACIVCNQMKGAFEWPTIEEAKIEIQKWWRQMREYWERNVKPLVGSN